MGVVGFQSLDNPERVRELIAVEPKIFWTLPGAVAYFEGKVVFDTMGFVKGREEKPENVYPKGLGLAVYAHKRDITVYIRLLVMPDCKGFLWLIRQVIVTS